MPEPTDDLYTFFEECIQEQRVRPAEEGKSDPQLIGLINNIMGKTNDFILVDYGCGKGRFIRALNNLNSPNIKVLEHMQYIGIDINKNYLSECDKLAEELNFKQRVKRFELKEPSQLYHRTLLIDYLFLVNTFHEMRPFGQMPIDLVLQDLLFKLRYNGLMIVHELKHLLSGEKEFITFDEDDVSFLFQDIEGLTCNIFPFKSKKRQIEMYNAYIIRTTPRFIPIEYFDLEYRLFELLKRKQTRLIRKLTNFENKNSRRFAYLTALYTNTSKAVEIMEANINIWRSGEVRCYNCGYIVTVKVSTTDSFHLDCEAVIKCPNCGLRKKYFRPRAFATEENKNYKMLRRYYPKEFEEIYHYSASRDEIALHEKIAFNTSLEVASRLKAISYLGELRNESFFKEKATSSLEKIAEDASLEDEIQREATKWLNKANEID